MMKKIFTEYLCIPTKNMTVLSATTTQTGINIIYSRISSKSAALAVCVYWSIIPQADRTLVFKRDDLMNLI
jgi:hypothetical protein